MEATGAGPAQPVQLLLFPHQTVCVGAPSGIVIYYNYMVPEGERHDSAIKRNKEALSAELKLWESYLEKVKPTAQKHATFAQTMKQ